MPDYAFEVGKTYKTQGGAMVTVLGRAGAHAGVHGDVTLKCSDGKCRYDRGDLESNDFGRVTGTAFGYSCPDNFDREAAGLPRYEDLNVAQKLAEEVARQCGGCGVRLTIVNRSADPLFCCGCVPPF